MHNSKGYTEKRGTEGTLTLGGQTCDQVWAAVVKVADADFEVRERDQQKGIIRAERTLSAHGNGAWIDIYIVPPTSGSDRYTIQVFNLKQNPQEQDWEKKVLRDVTDVLAGR